MAKKIYALLVGITNYDPNVLLDNGSVIFPPLNGCVNDAKKLRSYLETNYQASDLHIMELHNEQATRENICEQFLTHLGQAGEEDAVLFYFSGHGTQEEANACFTTETDNRLEALVAWYNEQTAGHCLIADKELRYLVYQVSKKKPHITVIIDCCHSGDMTRNFEIVKANYTGPVEKKSKGAYAFAERAWDQFIFHEQFSPDDLRTKGLKALLPEGDHILFSASESNESAYEIRGEGIFTKQLTDILQITNGNVTNQVLFDRISMCMKYGYVQKPRLYTPAAAEKLTTTGFLHTTGFVSPGTAMAYYNPHKGWMLNRGEINGLYRALEIDLVNCQQPSQVVRATVTETFIDHVVLQPTAEIDTSGTYTADVDFLARKTIRLYLSLDEALPKDASLLMDAIVNLPNCKIELVSDEADAHYTLQQLNDMYYITLPNDRYRPLSSVSVCPDFDEITMQLQHLARWDFMGDMAKAAPGNPDRYLGLEYALGSGNYQPLVQQNAFPEIIVHDWVPSADSFKTDLKIRLTNRSAGNLYVAILYLDINHASDTFLLEPAPYLLNQGDAVELNVDGDPNLPVEFYLQGLYYNYERYLERFKVIVSDLPFETYPLKLDALPEPPLPGKKPDMEERGQRRGGVGRSASLKGWFVTTINLICVNPSYNTISAGRLKQMLDDKLTASFAEGLYFDIPNDNNPLDYTVILKPNITIADTMPGHAGEQQRGVIVDIANWWSRRKRNKYYDNITRRFPERLKIVSEGDSWFQHPLVYDIIDHLSKVYAIRCAAAAADTLSNYISGAQKRGEYFLDLLTEVKPAIFLISGGGNDILGSQFREFLLEQPYSKGFKNSTDGKVFLKESFGFQIDKLMNIYSSIFDLLKNQFPEMKTIVHGYDYPVHLDYPDKGWLGRYMIEKGIAEPADRRILIRYIMDEFNTRLQQVVKQFEGTVFYIDLRGTVLYQPDIIDQWYDEIHPNIDGFQSIGLKFIKQIESLR